MTEQVRLTVNGVPHEIAVEPRQLLVHALREDLGLTGTHVGCDTSQCGACTVQLNGAAVKSCTVLAVQADGGAILTIEGMAPEGGLHALQNAFWEKHGLQCGYCTPGMLMLMTELLRENPNADRETIRTRLNDNICRCTGYEDIVNSVERAVELMRTEKAAP